MPPKALPLLLAFLLAASCSNNTSDVPPNQRDGGAYKPRQECNKPAFACYESCAKRKASKTCDGCCFDQRLLCDKEQPFAFESCESAP